MRTMKKMLIVAMTISVCLGLSAKAYAAAEVDYTAGTCYELAAEEKVSATYIGKAATDIFPLAIAPQQRSIFTSLHYSEVAIAIRNDGTVVTTGSNNRNQQDGTDTWQYIVDVAYGFGVLFGLQYDGTIVASESFAKLNPDMAAFDALQGAVAITATHQHLFGLMEDGTVAVARLHPHRQVRNTTALEVAQWTDIVAFDTAGGHIVGLRADGTVVAAGTYGVVGPFSPYAVDIPDTRLEVSQWQDIVDVAAGGTFTVGLVSDGTVVVTGSDADGVYAAKDWTGIVAIAAGERSVVGLKADGTVVAAGYNNETERGYQTGWAGEGRADVSEFSDIVAIAAGYRIIGLRYDGTVVASGMNTGGDVTQLNYVYDVSGWYDIKLPGADTLE